MMRSCLLFAALLPCMALAQVEVHDITTRPEITLRLGYSKAPNAFASAVLFQGGGGAIGIFPNGSIRNENFLSGGAKRFTDNGISVAIVDVPSDRSVLEDFRHTREHAEDAAAVIAFLRQREKLPVWAIGTSNGSLSAATAAAMLGERGPDGVVLTASTTRQPVSAAHPVTLAKLDEITVPVLFVHHKEDRCVVTPYEAIPEVMATMKKAKRVELITVDGGEDSGNPCHTGHHQFLGIEASVTRKIAAWIRAYQSGGAPQGVSR